MEGQEVVIEQTAAEQTAQTPPVPAQEEPKEPVKDPKFDSRFAALSKREKEVLAKEQAAKERLSKLDHWERQQEEIKANPLKALEVAGISYDELTKLILSDGKPDPLAKVSELETKLQEFETKQAKEREETEKRALQEDQARVEKLIDAYKKEIDSVLEQKKDEFELIHAQGMTNEVYSIVEKYFYETGQVLEPEVAASYLENELEQQAKGLLSLKKFAQKQDANEHKEPLQEKKPSGATLTNARTVPPVAASSNPGMDDKERLKRAMERLSFR